MIYIVVVRSGWQLMLCYSTFVITTTTIAIIIAIESTFLYIILNICFISVEPDFRLTEWYAKWNIS